MISESSIADIVDLSQSTTTKSTVDLPCAVILTAIQKEYSAVRLHLVELTQEKSKQNTIFERGIFKNGRNDWQVGIVEVGMGNTNSGIMAERAISHFNPSVMIFVGIAGGIKDVKLGDLVVAEKVYDYESGKIGVRTFTRPEVGNSSYAILQRAKYVARDEIWKNRIKDNRGLVLLPSVIVKPIATGEKVLTSTSSKEFNMICRNFNDAVAIEMEGKGFLSATHAYPHIEALIVRGISDLIDDKDKAEKQGYQEIASSNASAFAFEVLSQFKNE